MHGASVPKALSVQGLDALNRKLARMPAGARKNLRGVLDTSADEMVSLARALAPVKEGDLKASIKKLDGQHELQVLVQAGDRGTGPPRAIEFGHGNAAPRPYFWPAYRSLRKRIRGRITRAINRVAKGFAGGGDQTL